MPENVDPSPSLPQTIEELERQWKALLKGHEVASQDYKEALWTEDEEDELISLRSSEADICKFAIAKVPGLIESHGALTQRVQELERYDLRRILAEQKAWSERTFGPEKRTEGNLKHIEKELAEIRQDPTDIVEWIDVAMLANDGAWRHGATPEEAAEAYLAKLAHNQTRTYLRTPEDQPSEHVRSSPSTVETQEGDHATR